MSKPKRPTTSASPDRESEFAALLRRARKMGVPPEELLEVYEKIEEAYTQALCYLPDSGTLYSTSSNL